MSCAQLQAELTAMLYGLSIYELQFQITEARKRYVSYNATLTEK